LNFTFPVFLFKKNISLRETRRLLNFEIFLKCVESVIAGFEGKKRDKAKDSRSQQNPPSHRLKIKEEGGGKKNSNNDNDNNTHTETHKKARQYVVKALA
jgi:hypothetical protein